MNLTELSAIAQRIPAPDLAGEASDLAERYEAGRVCVACLGQFKRGKSTLINALLGADVLPTGTLPVTAVPLLVRHGSMQLRARTDGQWHERPMDALQQLVASDGDATDPPGLTAIELFYPAPILERGLCLLDTPGLGSVKDDHDAETQAALPRIDAALLVIGADPPLSGAEVELVQQLDPGVTALMLVLAKADRVSVEEAKAALDYARKTIRRETGRTATATFVVSATETLAGRPDAEWNRLTASLGAMSGCQDDATVRSHALRGTVRIAALLRTRIAERIELLSNPAAAAARQAARLVQIEDSAQRATSLASARVKSDMGSAMTELWKARDRFVATTGPRVEAEYSPLFDRGWWSGAIRTHQSALRAAAPLVRHALSEWEEIVRTRISERVTHLTTRATDEMETLRQGLSETSGVALSPLVAAAHRHADALNRYYFHDLESEYLSQWSWRRPVEGLMPARLRRPRIKATANRYLAGLLDRNTVIAVSDVDMWLGDVERQLERWMKEMLTAIASAAADHAATAEKVRTAGESAVQEEVNRLRGLLDQLDSLVAG